MLPRSRRLWAISLLTVLSGCTGEEGGDGKDVPAEPAVVFDTGGGDAFTWNKIVSGTADCGSVTLSVNDTTETVPVESSSFETRVALQPGPNVILGSCGDEADAAEIVFDQRLEIHPTAWIDLEVRGDAVVLDARGSSPARGDKGPLTYRWSPDEEHPGTLQTAGGKTFRRAIGGRLTLRAPERDGEYYVALDVTDGEGRSDQAKTYFVVEEGVARAVDMAHEHPSWIDRAVIYAPIPALWGNGGPRTVEKRLRYLKDLGVDALWLWPPVNERATGEEYAITDYFKLDPSWKPRDEFLDMVRAAHRLDLRVLADFVPNHMSARSPYFRDAKEQGERSAYWDFFDRDASGEPTHYFDWTHLPNLNFENPEVRTMIQEAFSYWVDDMELDGFRVDVAWGIKRRRPDYWTPWRRELKRIEPDLMLIAEAPGVDPYYFDNGFDIGYDWSHDVGQWAWTSVFDFPEEAGALLQGALTDGGSGYPEDAVIMRFLNNNDTGIRFVDQHGPEMTRVGATLQFTVPGVPAMFAGDEIGASYEPYSNLTPIPWRDKYNLLGFYKRLIELKGSVPALASREMEILDTGSSSSFAYLRPAPDPADEVLVVLNFGDKARVELPDRGELATFLDANPAPVDLLSRDDVKIDLADGSASLRMDGVSSLVIAGGRQ